MYLALYLVNNNSAQFGVLWGLKMHARLQFAANTYARITRIARTARKTEKRVRTRDRYVFQIGTALTTDFLY